MTNAESIQALMRESQFDSVKVKLALELVKYEIQKSIQENCKAD